MEIICHLIVIPYKSDKYLHFDVELNAIVFVPVMLRFFGYFSTEALGSCAVGGVRPLPSALFVHFQKTSTEVVRHQKEWNPPRANALEVLLLWS